MEIWSLSSEIKQEFFKAVALSVPLYNCPILSLKKRREKKQDGNRTEMLRAVLGNSSC